MRDRFLITYSYRGEKHLEFGSFKRIQTIKEFAQEVIYKFIG